jgi:hypothetical protein
MASTKEWKQEKNWVSHCLRSHTSEEQFTISSTSYSNLPIRLLRNDNFPPLFVKAVQKNNGPTKTDFSRTLAYISTGPGCNFLAIYGCYYLITFSIYYSSFFEETDVYIPISVPSIPLYLSCIEGTIPF